MDVSLHRADPPDLTQVIVAVPVRNEAARLGRLLQALCTAASRSALPVTALVLANDCTDRSALICRNFRHPLLTVETHEIALPPAEASAGIARGIAMDLGARDGALLMTTDGDAVPDADWIAAALRATMAGADLVCGTIDADCGHVHATVSGARITRAENAYSALQHEVRHRIDRMAARQPMEGPRPHYMESAASLAIRADVYRAMGGLPRVRSSEDRALVHRAESHGATIRYTPDMRAWVSARLHGRAEGGMADCLRQRMHDPDPLADQAMLPVEAIRQLWSQAMAGLVPQWPDRSWAQTRLRASDLEAMLPELAAFAQDIHPQFRNWSGLCMTA